MLVFQAAKRAGWLSTDDNAYPKASHVGFGLVLGDDKKRFRTRSSEVVRLADLLDEAKSRCKTTLIERGMILNGLSFVLFVLNVVLSLCVSYFCNYVYEAASIFLL